MVGILVVTHGYFGKELIQSMGMISGMVDKCIALSLTPEDDVATLRKEVREKTEELYDGDGVLLLTDILGGSPFNVCAECLDEEYTELVAGVNLPMLIEACEMRDKTPVKELAKYLVASTCENVINAREKFNLKCNDEGIDDMQNGREEVE